VFVGSEGFIDQTVQLKFHWSQ